MNRFRVHFSKSNVNNVSKPTRQSTTVLDPDIVTTVTRSLSAEYTFARNHFDWISHVAKGYLSDQQRHTGAQPLRHCVTNKDNEY